MCIDDQYNDKKKSFSLSLLFFTIWYFMNSFQSKIVVDCFELFRSIPNEFIMITVMFKLILLLSYIWWNKSNIHPLNLIDHIKQNKTTTYNHCLYVVVVVLSLRIVPNWKQTKQYFHSAIEVCRNVWKKIKMFKFFIGRKKIRNQYCGKFLFFLTFNSIKFRN